MRHTHTYLLRHLFGADKVRFMTTFHIEAGKLFEGWTSQGRRVCWDSRQRYHAYAKVKAGQEQDWVLAVEAVHKKKLVPLEGKPHHYQLKPDQEE